MAVNLLTPREPMWRSSGGSTTRRGKGVGKALLFAILAEASVRRLHTLIAGVNVDNAASLRLHERLGFERVAHFREVGYKFGRFLDPIFSKGSLC